jgi:hypothetical protein
MPQVKLMKKLIVLAALALVSCEDSKEIPVTRKEVAGCYGVVNKTLLRIDAQGAVSVIGEPRTFEASFDEPSQMLTLSNGVQYDSQKERLYLFRNRETSYLITRLRNEVVILVFKGDLAQVPLKKKAC